MTSTTFLRQYLADNQAEAAMPIYDAYREGQTWPGKAEENVIGDIVNRIARFGEASDKQLSYLRTLLGRIAERGAAAVPAPEGRKEFRGTVISVKEKESRFGVVTKVLLKTRDGWKAYGTLPRGADEAVAGDDLILTATLVQSNDDPGFAFFSRPTNARVILKAPAEVTAGEVAA